MAETQVQPLWRRFGREYVENNVKKAEWFPHEPEPERPPTANVYQENYAPLDPAGTYVRKRQFAGDPDVWTGAPFSGELYSKAEFSPKCNLVDLQYLPTWHKVS